MNRDDVIRWAESEAICSSADHKEFDHDGLLKFAEMVSTAERRKHQSDIEHWKAQAAQAEKWRGMAHARHGDGQKVVQEIQREAQEWEREACAKVCDALSIRHFHFASDCAKAIRARGKK